MGQGTQRYYWGLCETILINAIFQLFDTNSSIRAFSKTQIFIRVLGLFKTFDTESKSRIVSTILLDGDAYVSPRC